MIRCLVLVCACLVLTALPLWAQEMVSVEAPDVLGFSACAMVPAAPLAELTQAQVKTAGGTLTFTRQGRSFSCTTGSTTATVNGKKMILPLAPFARAQVTYIPLRACVEALGGTLTVNAARTVAQVKLPNLAQSVELPFVPMVTDDDNGKPKPVAVKEFRDSSDQLYVMNPDGSNERRLSYLALSGHALPVISARGDRWVYLQKPVIFPYGSVFTRNIAQFTSTCLLKADIVNGPVALYVYMTADGKTVWYSVVSDTQANPELAIVRVPFDGGKPEKVVESITFDISADGTWLAYETMPQGENANAIHEVRVRNVVSGKEWSLGAGVNPLMTADGRTVLFYRFYKVGEKDVIQLLATCTLDPTRETQQVHAVTDAGDMEDEDAAEFTPNGSAILFIRRNKQSDSNGIFMMNLDRSNCRQLTREYDTCPIASPDGKYLYFIREDHIYRMRFDGSELAQLTRKAPPLVRIEKSGYGSSTTTIDQTKSIHQIAFSPDGSKLYFIAQPQAMFGWGEE